MAWNTPALLTTGYRIRDTDWNQQLVENLQALDQHRHTGIPGDGSALAVPRPILHAPVVSNTAAVIDIYTETFLANQFGNNGTYLVRVFFLFTNTSGVNRTITVFGNLDGTVNGVPTTVGGATTRAALSVDFGFSNSGATNAQLLHGLLYDPAGGGAAVKQTTVIVGAVDTTLAGKIYKLSLQMSVALGTVSFEVLGGYVIGPSASAP